MFGPSVCGHWAVILMAMFEAKSNFSFSQGSTREISSFTSNRVQTSPDWRPVVQFMQPRQIAKSMWLASARVRWLILASPAARHLMDISLFRTAVQMMSMLQYRSALAELFACLQHAAMAFVSYTPSVSRSTRHKQNPSLPSPSIDCIVVMSRSILLHTWSWNLVNAPLAHNGSPLSCFVRQIMTVLMAAPEKYTHENSHSCVDLASLQQAAQSSAIADSEPVLIMHTLPAASDTYRPRFTGTCLHLQFEHGSYNGAPCINVAGHSISGIGIAIIVIAAVLVLVCLMAIICCCCCRK